MVPGGGRGSGTNAGAELGVQTPGRGANPKSTLYLGALQDALITPDGGIGGRRVRGPFRGGSRQPQLACWGGSLRPRCQPSVPGGGVCGEAKTLPPAHRAGARLRARRGRAVRPVLLSGGTVPLAGRRGPVPRA